MLLWLYLHRLPEKGSVYFWNHPFTVEKRWKREKILGHLRVSNWYTKQNFTVKYHFKRCQKWVSEMVSHCTRTWNQCVKFLMLTDSVGDKFVVLLCFLFPVSVANLGICFLFDCLCCFFALLDSFQAILTYFQMLAPNVQSTGFWPIKKCPKLQKKKKRPKWEVIRTGNSLYVASLSLSFSITVAVHLRLSSLYQTGDTAVSLRKVQLHLNGYVLMKWTTSLIQAHIHRTCDIPDSSAAVASQANRTCHWSRPFFLSQPRERRAIKSNWSLQQCWDLGPRRPQRSGCLIIMWPSCWFW